MDDPILYLSDESRLRAFERSWAKLEASTAQLDFDALRLCVRLLPRTDPETTSEPNEKLKDFLLQQLREPQPSETLYQIAEACSSNAAFADRLYTKIRQSLTDAAELVIAPRPQNHHDNTTVPALTAREESAHHDEQTRPVVIIPAQGTTLGALAEEQIPRVAAFLAFLKCSFWLPLGSHHDFGCGLVGLLAAFLGIEGLDEASLDALSALLSLLSRRQQGSEATKADLGSASGSSISDRSIMDQSLWARLQTLSSAHFETKSSKLFKVWFQWISHAVADNRDPEGVYEDLYWDRLRTGLLTGFADQRKYCLGIIRASLLAAQSDISTKTMRLQVDKRDVYVRAYDRYFILYETIVLDRYANQIEACLPELSALFGSHSVVTASMATTLLSSGLDPQVQEGIRKIVGNWYFGFISGSQSPLTKDAESLSEHTGFLITGFLPWATQGSLFTSTLKAMRTSTECSHGAALVKLISCFIVSEHAQEEYRDELVARVLGFVLDAGGKMFQMSVLYLLEGLIKGYNEAAQHGGRFSVLSIHAVQVTMSAWLICIF